ncbi:MAG: type II toxin-antitoxin system ParD family antitoxin [Proteobacteria bacterium]|nr:type II toxin-antitoxin system ParD family antitoxin [Pseudomonadota bacterium]
MNINLTPKLEEMVREKVKSGLYNNASEVVREALRMMEANDRRGLKIWTKDEIEAELIKGIESGFTEGNIDVEDIKKRGRERLNALRAKDAA